MKAWTDGFTISKSPYRRGLGRRSVAVRCGLRSGLPGRRSGGTRLGGRGRRGPVLLSVDLGGAQPASLAPRAREGARAPTELRDDAAGAAAGHTLPRLMGSVAQIVGVVAC